MTEFGSLDHSPGKRVLNNLKTICLRFWKVVVQRVAVIKLRVNNICGNGTGSFEVKIGADTTNTTYTYACVFCQQQLRDLSFMAAKPWPYRVTVTVKLRY